MKKKTENKSYAVFTVLMLGILVLLCRFVFHVQTIEVT